VSFVDELERDLVQAAERRRDALKAAAGVRARRRLGLRAPHHRAEGEAGAGPGLRARSLRRLALATALFALIGAATAGAGLLLLRGTVIPGPALEDVPRDQLPLPGTTRLTGLTAADPVAGRPPWTLRLARSSTGLLCSTVGQLDGGRFGLVGLDGRFRAYAERIVDSCGEQQRGSHASLVGARVFDAEHPREVRTVVNGVAGPSLRAVVLDVRGRARPVPVGPGGTFLAVLAGYPEDSGVQVELRFADGRVETHPLGRSATVAPDPEGGQAWKSTAFRIGDDRRSCVAFSTARAGGAGSIASSPAACGLMRYDGRRWHGWYFAAERLPGRAADRPTSLLSGGWRGHPPRTAVWGGTGDDVTKVAITGPGGIRTTPPIAISKTFFAVFPGSVDPADLAVTLRFADGRTRTFHGSQNLVTRKVPMR
jgi:hypothetical protein